MKVLAFGSDSWKDYQLVEREMRKLPPYSTVVQGDGPGADHSVRYVAKVYEHEVHTYVSHWDKYPQEADKMCNRQILQEEHTYESPIQLALMFGRGDSRCEDLLLRVRRVTPLIEIVIFKEQEDPT